MPDQHDTERPWLHILIPAYGRSPYLGETLASTKALHQPPGDVDVTVVDDGSPTEDVRRAAAGAGIEYERMPANLGIAGVFGRCAELSRGEYTVLLGSDDLVEPDYAIQVAHLATAFDRPAMLMPSVTVIDTHGQPARPLADRVKSWLAPRGDTPRLLHGDTFAASLLLGNWLYFPAIAWRTDVLRKFGFRPDLHTVMDLDLVLRIVFDGGAMGWSPTKSARYRRHPESASSRTAADGQRFAEERRVFAAAGHRAAELGWSRARRAAHAQPTSRLHRALSRAVPRPRADRWTTTRGR